MAKKKAEKTMGFVKFDNAKRQKTYQMDKK
jgi:hypothetical protein